MTVDGLTHNTREMSRTPLPLSVIEMTCFLTSGNRPLWAFKSTNVRRLHVGFWQRNLCLPVSVFPCLTTSTSPQVGHSSGFNIMFSSLCLDKSLTNLTYDTIVRWANQHIYNTTLLLTVRAIPKVKVELIVPVPLMTWLWHILRNGKLVWKLCVDESRPTICCGMYHPSDARNAKGEEFLLYQLAF